MSKMRQQAGSGGKKREIVVSSLVRIGTQASTQLLHHVVVQCQTRLQQVPRQIVSTRRKKDPETRRLISSQRKNYDVVNNNIIMVDEK